MTNLVFRRLNEIVAPPRYRWDAFLSPEPGRIEAIASAPEQSARTIVPKAPAQKTGPAQSRGPAEDKAKEAIG